MKREWVFCTKRMELIPKDQFYAEKAQAPMVMPDIAGYKSMATGEWIGGRRQHREHLRQHGLVEIGNEVKAHLATGQRTYKDPTIRQHVIEAVKRYS